MGGHYSIRFHLRLSAFICGYIACFTSFSAFQLSLSPNLFRPSGITHLSILLTSRFLVDYDFP
jgi:hypothetical protein